MPQNPTSPLPRSALSPPRGLELEPERSGDQSQREANRELYLHSANDDLENLAALIAAGARPSNNNAIGIAIKKNNWDCALALAPFCDSNLPDSKGSSPFNLALAHRSIGAIQLARSLLALGANPALIDTLTGADSLYRSVHGGSVELARLVLPLCNPKLQDTRYGYTPLMLAAARANLACVELLLPHSDLDAREERGRRVDELDIIEPARILILAYRAIQVERAALDRELPSAQPRRSPSSL